ncbi:hypothetical protein FCG41_02975 [Azotobacter chroococcum]|nr:hypothetical protein FCG41_02975 [Azotobacter chroococcum]
MHTVASQMVDFEHLKLYRGVLRHQFLQHAKVLLDAFSFSHRHLILGVNGVWGATEQKVHLSPVPARKPLWRRKTTVLPSQARGVVFARERRR